MGKATPNAGRLKTMVRIRLIAAMPTDSAIPRRYCTGDPVPPAATCDAVRHSRRCLWLTPMR